MTRRRGDRVRAWRAARGPYTFKHALVQEAAYDSLLKRTRELHGRVGDAILAASGDAADEQSEVLALHFTYGERYPEAWRFARLAGRCVRRRSASAAASSW